MRRREFITLLGGATVWPVVARAQVSAKRPTIAWLSAATAQLSASFLENFLRGMRELGYVEGRNFDMLYRYTDGYQERLPALTEEVIRLKPDVILAPAVISAVAARKVTSTIPIVSPALADAVHLGLIASEARPGGNVTGIEPYVAGLPAKQIEFAREIVPGASKIGLLTNLMDPKAPAQAMELEASARTAKINTISVDANHPDDLDGGFRLLSDEKVDVVIVLQTSMFLTYSRKIAASALERRLPTVYGYREHVIDGGLISYGVDLRWCYYRGAYFVDRILRGTAPGDLPIEFPTKMFLSINLKTASALGIPVQPILVARADEVIDTRRREFITLIGSTAIAWPLAADAQERMRRVGVLMNTTAEEPEAQSYLAAFQQGMQELGWSIGRNLRVDLRWGGGDAELIRRYAAELAALSPDVMLAAGGPIVSALQRASRTVPIIFAQSIDPVGSGIVASLARPGGNTTGFTQFEYSLSGKWAELLKEIAPRTRRVGVMRDPANPAGVGQWAIIQAAATAKGMEVIPLAVVNPSEIERGIAGFARDLDGGLVVPVSAGAIRYREAIIASAARHRLPAVYCYRHFVVAGALISYGPDLLSQYRRAAGYVDRILKGEKPADLPVQAPTKYELVINLKTAKALGLDVPPMLLARADEVIE